MEVVNPVEHLLLVQAILLEHWKSATQRAPSGLPKIEILSRKLGLGGNGDSQRNSLVALLSQTAF